MGAMQRRKGHDWERKVAAMFREALADAGVKRGWQSRSGGDAPDVDGTPFWVECKRGKKPNIRAALAQAYEAGGSLHGCGDPRPKIAVVKDDGLPATVTMHLDDFLDLVTEWWERGNK